MSKIAIIGATGRAGSQLLEEALRRGHTVTAIARNTDKLAVRPGVTVKQADALDAEALQQAISGSDVVISAAHFSTSKRLCSSQGSRFRRDSAAINAGNSISSAFTATRPAASIVTRRRFSLSSHNSAESDSAATF